MHIITIVSDDYTGNLCKENTLSQDQRGYSNAYPEGPCTHSSYCPTTKREKDLFYFIWSLTYFLRDKKLGQPEERENNPS